MTLDHLPPDIAAALTLSPTPAVRLNALMPALVKYLQCDRCFLYVREPSTALGKVAFCWVRSAAIPMMQDNGWKVDPSSLPDRDLMFAAALRAEPSIVVEDVETASPQTLNKQFERESFGHRALIHAHICYEKKLWGVLQPSVFDHPRHWTAAELVTMEQVVQAITPDVVAYVKWNHLVAHSNS